MPIFNLSCYKMVQLEQHEIEAQTKEAAVAEYVARINRGDVEVSNYKWSDITEGDIDVEEPKYEECDSCQERKPDVSTRTCVYQMDVNEDYEYLHTVCDDCEYEHAMDI